MSSAALDVGLSFPRSRFVDMADVHLQQGRAELQLASPTAPQEALAAENVDLRLLLAQAEINAQGLLAQAGIDAKERAASDKLQKLILEELHHRIKNTLATVSAIAHQSLRPPRTRNMPGTQLKAVCWRSAGLMISFCRHNGPALTLKK